MEDFKPQQLDPQRRAHAYVVTGSNAAGLARRFIRDLFCPDQCGQCAHCKKLDKEGHPDVRWVRSEGKNIKIDQVRALQQTAIYPPVEAPCKVFVLENAHHLSREAANSLLKILESPPDYVVLVLLSQQLGRILPTVLSRCRIVHSGERALQRDVGDLCWQSPQWLDVFETGEGEAPAIEPTPKAVADALGQKNLSTLHQATQAAFSALGAWKAHHVLQCAALLSKAGKDQQGYFLQGLAFLTKQSQPNAGPLALDAVRRTLLSYGALQANANAQLLLESTLLNLWEARRT